MANLPLETPEVNSNFNVNGQDYTTLSISGHIVGIAYSDTSGVDPVEVANALLSIGGAANNVTVLRTGVFTGEVYGVTYTVTFNATRAEIRIGDDVTTGNIFHTVTF